MAVPTQPCLMSGFQAVKEASNLGISSSNQPGIENFFRKITKFSFKKNPKLIPLVKTWNPDIRLIGFFGWCLQVSVARASLEKIRQK